MNAIVNTLYTKYDDKMLHKMHAMINTLYTIYNDKMLHKNARYDEHPVYKMR